MPSSTTPCSLSHHQDADSHANPAFFALCQTTTTYKQQQPPCDRASIHVHTKHTTMIRPLLRNITFHLPSNSSCFRSVFLSSFFPFRRSVGLDHFRQTWSLVAETEAGSSFATIHHLAEVGTMAITIPTGLCKTCVDLAWPTSISSRRSC